MTGKMRVWSVKSMIRPDIVRWPAIIFSPENDCQTITTNLDVHPSWQPGELERKLSLKNYWCFPQMFHYHWDHKRELIKTCTLARQIMAKKFLCTHLEDQNGCMCIPDWIGIFKCWFFKRGKPSNLEKNINKQSREPTTNSMFIQRHCCRSHWFKARALTWLYTRPLLP